MIKPNSSNIPGMGAMTDTLDFVKNLWSGMGVPGMNMPGMSMPGMVMPTLSVEEINKQITDLKAVESWLTLNMNMLRGTIQALEVQAATISTLQTMGESFTASMTPPAREPAPEKPAAAPTPQASEEADRSGQQHASSQKEDSDSANLTAPLVNAAAWWNMLQDQFQQAVNSAMTTEPLVASADKPKSKNAKASAAAPASPGTTATPRKRKTTK